MRTCPSCGQTKEDSAFWHSARRCRKCVAQERSEHAREERDRIQEVFGTQTSLSGRRFKKLEQSARQQADARVPKTARDHIGNALLVLALLSVFGGIILTEESPLFLLLGFIFAGVAGWISAHLQQPREAAVSSIAATALRSSVDRVDRQQQEYEHFYLTADWRHLRQQVIARDGIICRRCKQQIQDSNEVTVDHIKPRSKFPELALAMSNLQVLCRCCNSSKGIS